MDLLELHLEEDEDDSINIQKITPELIFVKF